MDMTEVKECISGCIQAVISRIDDRLWEDSDGLDYLIVQLDRVLSLVQQCVHFYGIPPEIETCLLRARQYMQEYADRKDEVKPRGNTFQTTGCRGRPKINIAEDQLQLYLDYRADILKEFPNCGYRRMRGFLTARGLHIQWTRIQESMKRVCPEGILMRSLEINTIQRRTYKVRAPLSLWHIDGNHKLISETLRGQNEIEEFGIDWNGPLPSCNSDGNSDESQVVVVPQIELDIAEDELEEQLLQFNPLGETIDCGMDIYFKVVNCLQSLMQK
eukprot:gene2010-2287_t